MLTFSGSRQINKRSYFSPEVLFYINPWTNKRLWWYNGHVPQHSILQAHFPTKETVPKIWNFKLWYKQVKSSWTLVVIIRVCLLKTNNDFSSLRAIVCFSFLLLFLWFCCYLIIFVEETVVCPRVSTVWILLIPLQWWC